MLRLFVIIIIGISLYACKNSEQEKVQTEVLITDSTNITWSEHIAPIVFKNCTPCHHPGANGPFNLLSYNDAYVKAKLIRFVTQTNYMPPWPANSNYSHFVGEKVLSEKDKLLIRYWVNTNCKKGDTLKAPKPPTFEKGTNFRKPDLVLKLNEAVTIKNNGTDVFLIMKFPFQLKKDTILDFVEFVPHQKKLVHHVNGHLINYDSKRQFNYQTGSAISYNSITNLNNVYNDMHLPYTDALNPKFPTLTPNTVYYLPGFFPLTYPQNIGGYKLNKNGAFLLNNIHYGPSNKNLLDSSYLNVFFKSKAITRPVTETQLGTFGISKIEPEFIIPPNEVKTFTTQLKLNQTISLLSVNPHMHLIGKTFWAFALKQNGDTIPLIKIDKWDFRWQYYYTYKHPLKLEQGTTIKVIGVFDNTNENANNPFKPARTITNGNGVESMKTTEEMFQFIFTYMPYKDGDEKIDLGLH